MRFQQDLTHLVWHWMMPSPGCWLGWVGWRWMRHRRLGLPRHLHSQHLLRWLSWELPSWQGTSSSAQALPLQLVSWGRPSSSALAFPPRSPALKQGRPAGGVSRSKRTLWAAYFIVKLEVVLRLRASSTHVKITFIVASSSFLVGEEERLLLRVHGGLP